MLLSVLVCLLQKPSFGSRIESNYSVTTVMKFARPVDVASMNDPFQDARVISQDVDTVTVEVIHYPLLKQEVTADPQWRSHDAKMHAYLDPTQTCNWDLGMQKALVAALKKDGIDPNALDDKQLVDYVSHWLWRNTEGHDDISAWMIDLKSKPPKVDPALRAAFDSEKPNKKWSDKQTIEHELLGKQMFRNRYHGACTSSAVLQTTVMRALGIPTRIVVCVPSCDTNDPGQVALLENGIHHHYVKGIVHMASRVQGFCDHMFNEVYVGGKWVRLNYDILGQSPLSARFLGLMTHVLTLRDISEMNLSKTWGRRYALADSPHPAKPILSSSNPYMLLKATDHFGKTAHIENPPVHLELTTVTLTGIVPKGQMPKELGIRDDVGITIAEWVPEDDYHQMRDFYARVHGAKFRLVADGRPDIPLLLNGDNFNTGDLKCKGFGANFGPLKPVPGVTYRLTIKNVPGAYQWKPGNTTIRF